MASLGPGAPVRALYEGSKRLGGHRVVLRTLARRAATRPVPPLAALPGPPPVPAEAAARTRAAAAEILAGTVRLFGTPVEVGATPDWHGLLHDPGRWPVDDWWRIDLRSGQRPGDAKWVWELSRHQHLVVLARAVHLDPEEPDLRGALERQLWSWLAAAPPEVGVPWASNLEIALRCLAWLEILSLVGRRLDPALTGAMTRVLWHAGDHLLVELPYTLSTMPNNHLIADAVGLHALGRAFDHPRAHRWRALGSRLLTGQCRREIRGDGSSVEESLSYHRFVIELLVRHVCLAGGAAAPVRGALGRATAFLTGLGVLDGPVPQFGDWDAARALVSTGDPSDLRGTVTAALAVLGDGAEPEDRATHDEAAWYVGEGTPRPAARPHPASTAGGMVRVAQGPCTVFVRSHPPGWHGHADLTSVAVAVEGRWVLGDPGTGTYNGSLAVRDHFRGAAAHGVLRLGGDEPLRPHRVFRWHDRAGGGVRVPVRVGGGMVVVAWHDAYGRLDPPRAVVRTVYVDGGGVVVADWVEGAGGPEALREAGSDRTPPTTGSARGGRAACVERASVDAGADHHCWDLQFTSDPALAWEGSGATWTAALPSGRPATLVLPGSVTASRACTDPPAGWWSPTYGRIVPTSGFTCRGALEGPVVTELTLTDRPRHRVDAGRLIVETVAPADTVEVGVRWSGGRAEIRVGQGGRSERRLLVP